MYVVRRVSGEVTGAPPRGVVILCLLLTLVSAWVTDFIGIDAIFGAFVAGIIVPREHRSVFAFLKPAREHYCCIL